MGTPHPDSCSATSHYSAVSWGAPLSQASAPSRSLGGSSPLGCASSGKPSLILHLRPVRCLLLWVSIVTSMYMSVLPLAMNCQVNICEGLSPQRGFIHGCIHSTHSLLGEQRPVWYFLPWSSSQGVGQVSIPTITFWCEKWPNRDAHGPYGTDGWRGAGGTCLALRLEG